ncbi:MAG: DUF5069 domain-containing protein [Candidatus Tyrphobacter sp.]
MDLTKEYPRSVHEEMLGLVQLPRTIDKAKAVVHGNVGEYNYDCPMDQGLFEFLGVTGEELLDVVRTAKGDREIEERLAPIVRKKSPAEIERWNREWLSHRPEGRSLEGFLTVRSRVAPDREDVMTWPDLLDLDEKREVPVRVGV